MSGTGTSYDPIIVDDDIEVIWISSDDESSDDELSDDDDSVPVIVKYRAQKAQVMKAGMDAGADAPALPFTGRGEALDKTLEEIKDMKGLDVPEALSWCKPSDADRARYLAEVERQMREDVFGTKNPSTIIAAQARECCDIIDNVIFGGFLKRNIDYIVLLNQEGTIRKAGHCRSGFMKNGVWVKPEIKFNPFLLDPIEVKDNGEIGHRLCNGLVCKDKVAIIASVMMHEIVHLIIHHFVPRAIRRDKSSRSRKWAPHGTMFMSIARNLYGHTDHKVALNKEWTSASITKETAHIGLHVNFTFKGQSTPTRAVIVKANPRRAKVRLVDGAQEVGVPYPLLKRADPELPHSPKRPKRPADQVGLSTEQTRKRISTN